jgi:hypothetical protein
MSKSQNIATQARLWQAIPDGAREELFPAKFAQLRVDQAYSLRDLADDANGIVSAVMAMPVTTVIDVDAIRDGRANLRDFPVPRNAVLQRHASELIIATSVAAPRDAINQPYLIKAWKFKCNRQASDALFAPANEPFWIFGSVAAGEANTTNSAVFEDVDSREEYWLAPTDGCIWSRNCNREPLPDGDIGILIQLWEHDEGDVESARAGVAAGFAAAAGVLAATGVAAWIGAVTAGVGAIVQWILGFSNDDHIADETIVFNRNTIVQMVPDRRGGRWDVTRKFSDGDADYDLTVGVFGRPRGF